MNEILKLIMNSREVWESCAEELNAFFELVNSDRYLAQRIQSVIGARFSIGDIKFTSFENPYALHIVALFPNNTVGSVCIGLWDCNYQAIDGDKSILEYIALNSGQIVHEFNHQSKDV
ncbi:hypothetical protein [Acinetobacter baumannii]|uniref:hypothetical protein n=1 Tax=Acinetobacter baumannii TaxID=470 RepID=UPI0007F901C5|nr:hypothetical protein [Acinetobacter baumannii]OBM16980.1 hypothetical protein A9933_08285 [Acinetobacter baumannii]